PVARRTTTRAPPARRAVLLITTPRSPDPGPPGRAPVRGATGPGPRGCGPGLPATETVSGRPEPDRQVVRGHWCATLGHAVLRADQARGARTTRFSSPFRPTRPAPAPTRRNARGVRRHHRDPEGTAQQVRGGPPDRP